MNKNSKKGKKNIQIINAERLERGMNVFARSTSNVSDEVKAYFLKMFNNYQTDLGKLVGNTKARKIGNEILKKYQLKQ